MLKIAAGIFFLALIVIMVFVYKDVRKDKNIIVPAQNNGPDLSNIIIATDEEVQTSLKDENGVSLGEITFEDPIADPISGETIGSVSKILLYSDPMDGKYLLTLSSNAVFDAEIFVYDKNGDPLVKKVNKNPGSYNYQINFNKASILNAEVKEVN